MQQFRNMRSSNPALRDRVLVESRREALTLDPSQLMTIDGTLTKVSLMLLVALAAATFTYGQAMAGSSSIQAWAFGGGIIGFILALVISFKPHLAPKLALPYAAGKGLMLGAISATYAAAFQGIVIQAVLLTFGVALSMFGLWRSGLVKVTKKFQTIVMAAMGAIFLAYMASFIMSLFGGSIGFIHSAGPIGIGFSVVVIIVVSLMLMIDFDMISKNAAAGAPKYMEWYGAFALLVTLIWLYLEMLRLLAKLRGRD